MSGAEPRILSADPGALALDVVQTAAEALAAGQLVVFPTDTVYGIACRADDEQAVKRLFAAKRRPLDRPLPLLLAAAEVLTEVMAEVDTVAFRLAQAFWPGALTIVVRKSERVLDTVTAGKNTVGVRVPGLALTRAILAACSFPVAVTSANLSDAAPAIEVTDLPAELLQHVSVLIDGGRCPGEQPSTVVDTTVTPPRILRAGPITAAAIAAVLAPASRS